MKTVESDAIAISATIPAPVEKVWQAWTDPFTIVKWFGSDPNGKVLPASLEIRKGGSYEITFKDADRTEHTCYGVYKEVDEFNKLSFSWTWKSEPGVESLVTVSLTVNDNRTQMLFQHAHVGTESSHNYLSG